MASVPFGSIGKAWVSLVGKFEDLTVTACSRQLGHIIDFMVSEGYHELGLIGSSFGGLLSIIVGAAHS